MQITLSVNGRFHAYEFAQELERLASLNQLITCYPANWIEKRWGISASRIASFTAIELLRRTHASASKIFYLGNPQHQLNSWFDFLASRRVSKDSDVFVGWSGNSLQSIRKAKALGQKTVLERHSAHIETQTQWLEEEFDRFGLKFRATHPKMREQECEEYAEADWISVPSQFVKRTFLERGFEENRIRVHPLSVNVEQFKPARKKSTKIRFFYGGHISLRKGVLYLLEAFSKLRDPDAELFLVGGMDAEMRPLIKKYLTNKVTFLPAQNQNEFAKVMAESHLVCLPSIEDGFNQVVLQAMACAVPVLASSQTGAIELVESGKEGFIVPPRDSDAILGRMEWALTHRKELDEMGQQAHLKTRRKHTWAHYAQARLVEFNEFLRH